MGNRVQGVLVSILIFAVIPLSGQAQHTITTIAGGGPKQIPALQASIGTPTWVTPIPNLISEVEYYIADSSSNRVLLLTASGTITVFAGNMVAGYSGDGGPAVAAAMNSPESVVALLSGNTYIADTGNNVIRRVDVAGNIHTVVGTGQPCAVLEAPCGDGGAATNAQLSSPSGIYVDSAGNIIIADRLDHRIRKVVAATGAIFTIAGTGSPGYQNDGFAATLADLNSPGGVFLDGSGNLFIADSAIA